MNLTEFTELETTRKLLEYGRATSHLYPLWFALESYVNMLPVAERLPTAQVLAEVLTELHPTMYVTAMEDGRAEYPDVVRLATGIKEDKHAHQVEERMKAFRDRTTAERSPE